MQIWINLQVVWLCNHIFEQYHYFILFLPFLFYFVLLLITGLFDFLLHLSCLFIFSSFLFCSSSFLLFVVCNFVPAFLLLIAKYFLISFLNYSLKLNQFDYVQWIQQLINFLKFYLLKWCYPNFGFSLKFQHCQC